MSVKVNRIELDKTKGLTVQVRNGVNTQTIFLDGAKITITVEGPGGTSTIEQTPTTVTVTADNFIVNAKTITETGSLEATMRSGASSVMLTPASAMVMATEIGLTGTANINAMAPTVTVTGAEATTVMALGGELLLEGNNVTMTGTAAMEIAAPNIVMAGALEYIPIA